ncbi:MAG TPA: hypothetical protein VKY92_05850 [Verrucomicrobiae bacterium]|jgi:hypothetical protein|nr:hypothetical protein [Verrucomicrobiae bacterium]
MGLFTQKAKANPVVETQGLRIQYVGVDFTIKNHEITDESWGD